MSNNGISAAGGIIRNSDGLWIKGFNRNIGKTYILAAELWGNRDGLYMALESNIQSLDVETDAITGKGKCATSSLSINFCLPVSNEGVYVNHSKARVPGS